MMNTKIRKFGLLGMLAVMLTAAVFALSFVSVGRVAHAATTMTADELVKTFTASKGTIAPEEEGVIYTLDGEDTYAQLSTEQFTNGDFWYVNSMTNRNVVMLRLKNETSATRAKLVIKSNIRTMDYDAGVSVEFDLFTDDEFHTYYIDLSANPDIKGIMKGIRIVPEATSGSMHIVHVSFEREKPYYDYAGEITSATSDGVKVTVTGTVNTNATEVQLYRTNISNMDESLEGLTPLAFAAVKDGKFTIEFPHHNGTVSMLSSTFIVTADNVKVSAMFKITNWRDFSDNPYEFTLADRVVNVTDSKYGAKGDAYTDDTAAIQAAIDEVSELGGGTVVLPGEDSKYGKRYIATTVWLKDNVELRIEKGAVLWQTFRDSDYHYPGGLTPGKGHDHAGIKWGAQAMSLNYPLIYGGGVKNIKITGGGAVRLCDEGSSVTNEYKEGGYSISCASTIHLIPIGLYDCENVEVSDIDILRTNCYNMLIYKCTNVYLGNLTLTEGNCVSGDGFSFGVGTKNVVIERCMLYTNDDAIVLVSHSIAEPRGTLWWHANPLGGDNRLTNITMRGSCVTPGNIIVFIPWGNDNNDYTLQAISRIYMYDNLLGNKGSSQVVNVWMPQGDPYGITGKPAAPVYDVQIHDNEYLGSVPAHMSAMTKHGVIADCGNMENTNDFIDTAFSYNLGFWQYEGEYGTEVKNEGSTAIITGENNGVWQAPELYAGTYNFAANVKTAGGTAKLFATDSFSGKVIAEKEIAAGSDSVSTLEFTLPVRTVVRLGVMSTSESGTVSFSAPAISKTQTLDGYCDEDFEGEVNFLRAYGFKQVEDDGIKALGMDKVGYASLEMREQYASSDYDMKFDFIFDENATKSAQGGGVSVELRKTSSGKYIVRYDGFTRKIYIEKYTFSKNTTVELASADLKLLDKCWYQLGVSLSGGSITAYLDGNEILSTTDETPLTAGSTVMKATGVKLRLDNVSFCEEAEFGHSVNWKEGQGVDPDGKPTPPKKSGCKSSMAAGELGVIGAVLTLSAVIMLVSRKKSAACV